MGRLEEIEKRYKSGYFGLSLSDDLWLIQEVHRLRAAIEKHKKDSWPKGEILIGYDQELYKALED